MTDLTLFHTAEVHRATFDALAARIAPDARLDHVVRPDWLARAQGGIGDDLAAEIIRTIAAKPASLCTCTTIGAVAAEAGAIRIDWPMMQAAAHCDGEVLLVFCLDSTRGPSTALLCEAFQQEGRPEHYRALALPDLWPMFTAGGSNYYRRPAMEFSRVCARWTVSAGLGGLNIADSNTISRRQLQCCSIMTSTGCSHRTLGHSCDVGNGGAVWRATAHLLAPPTDVGG